MLPILNTKTGYLDYNAVFEDDVDVYMILGQRADGKTYGALYDAVEHFIKYGVPSAYIRRFDESIKKAIIQDLFKPHSAIIHKLTRGKWTGTTYKSRRFYLTRKEGDKIEIDSAPFCFCYSLNTWETDKGPDSGEFANIIFDEYVSASKYLPNEYSKFENVLSSILRNRGKSRLIMLGNPINQICPYFDEFNIQPHKIKPGDIVYRLSEDGYKLKFVYVPPMDAKFRKSAKFFSFKKTTSSITSGYWEFGEFPHPPAGLVKDSECLGSFGIMFRGQFAQCDYYAHKDVLFCVWRPANGDKLLNSTNIAIFSDMHLFQHNIYTAWTRNFLTEFYEKCVKNNRQYFTDNKTGNLIKQWYDEFLRRGGRF